MKLVFLALAALALSSCNTTIGIGRDIRQGFVWSKNKIQERQAQSHQNSSYQDDSGAPVY